MQKIYLLLRNNNQLGPFTIEELLEQELLPSDLVWIEGKSLAWSYASELNLLKLARHSGEGLHHSAPGTPQSSVHSAPHGRRKHHRFKRGEIVPPATSPEQKPRTAPPLTPAPMSSAFSAGDVERKAEELRQRALAAERVFHHRQPTPAQSDYQPDLIGAMDSDIEVVYHKKKRIDIPFPQMLVGGMVIAMLVAGWYGKPLFRQKVDTVDATATPLMHTSENAAAATFKPAPVPAVLPDTAAITDSMQGAAPQASLAVYTEGGASTRPASGQKAEVSQESPAPETTSVEPAPVVQKKSEPEESVAKEPEKTTPIVVTAKKEPEKAEPSASVSEEPKEKKRGFLKGLFKKKKSRDGQPEEEGADTGSSEGQSN